MTWDAFGERLAFALRDVTDRVRLIVVVGDDPRRYVQLAGVADRLDAEAPSDDVVAGASLDALAAAGWTAPTAGQPSWTATLARPALTVELAALAERCVVALRDGLGIATPDVLRYRAWRETEGMPPGVTWSQERIDELDPGDPALEIAALGLDRLG